MVWPGNIKDWRWAVYFSTTPQVQAPKAVGSIPVSNYTTPTSPEGSHSQPFTSEGSTFSTMEYHIVAEVGALIAPDTSSDRPPPESEDAFHPPHQERRRQTSPPAANPLKKRSQRDDEDDALVAGPSKRLKVARNPVTTLPAPKPPQAVPLRKQTKPPTPSKIPKSPALPKPWKLRSAAPSPEIHPPCFPTVHEAKKTLRRSRDNKAEEEPKPALKRNPAALASRNKVREKASRTRK